MLYLILKFVHVLSMAVWLGGLIMMLLINRLLTRAGETAALQAFGRQGARLSSLVFIPAMVVTLITGIGMVHAGDLSFGSAWIIWGMIGLVFSVILGAVLTGGAARKLGARVARGEIDAAGIAAAQRRIMMFALLNLLLLVSIVGAMVFKP